MSGDELRVLREQLQMDPFVFAMLLGVHVSTIYRWEAKRGQPVQMDPLQRELLSRLATRLPHTAEAQRVDLGRALVAGLVAGGAIAGLLVLLKFLAGEQDPRRHR